MPLDQDTKDYLQALISGVKARIEANHDISMIEFKAIKEKQDLTNGRVKNLENVTSIWKWISNNKIIAVVLLIFFWFLIDWSSTRVNYKKTISNKTGIEFNEK